MTGFWAERTVLITGGGGFLGRAVRRAVERRDPARVLCPSSADYDLREAAQVTAMLDDHRPDVVIHLAARVGGIGANLERPADLYLDNLLMGTHVLEATRRADTAKTVIVGTICSYPKFTPVPFEAIYLMPTNLYGPGDKFHPAVSHVIPALVKKCVDAVEAGADHIDVWGTGSASREFLYVDDAAEGIALATERYDDADPVNLGTDEERPIRDLVVMIAEMVGFAGEIRWDTTRPDGQPRRRVDPSRARRAFGFEAEVRFEDGLRRTIDWYRGHRDEAEAHAY